MPSKRKKLILYTTAIIIMFTLLIFAKQPNTEVEEDKLAEQTEKQETSTDKKTNNNNISTDDLSHLTLDGESFNINEYSNHNNIIISFFSPTCPYCTQQTELFEKYREELDYEVFYVPFKVDFDRGKEHIVSLGYNVDQNRILEDPDSAFANQFNLQATPTNLFATHDHTTVRGVVGLTSGEAHGKTDKEFLVYLFNLLKEEQ